jgi:hypothetical protein
LGGTSLGGASPIGCEGDGFFDHDGDASSACIERSNCAPGTYVTDEGSATSDRQCATCPAETFSTVDNASECTPWTVCGAEALEAAPGTSTSDRVCTSWTLQFGSAKTDSVEAIDIDQNGNVVVAGHTSGVLPGQTSAGEGDVFVRKLDPQGNELWVRQFGTSDYDYADALSVDEGGNIYVAGFTSGTLPGQTALGSADAFVRKYDAQGVELWTRQLGTKNSDYVSALTTDPTGGIYLCGMTNGAFPGETNAGAFDAFVRKYDALGSVLHTQQFGTASYDDCRGASTDASGNVFVGGRTYDALPGQTSAGHTDTYVRKYSPAGIELWTRQDGSNEHEFGRSTDADSEGNVYFSGETDGTLPGQMSAGEGDAFVRKYDSAGSALWVRQYGTAHNDVALCVAVDTSSNVFVVGGTSGTYPGQTNAGQTDIVVRKYDASGVELWTRQLGTSGLDGAVACSLDAAGHLYVAGQVGGTLAGQTSFGEPDAFVIKLSP